MFQIIHSQNRGSLIILFSVTKLTNTCSFSGSYILQSLYKYAIVLLFSNSFVQYLMCFIKNKII